MTRGISRRRFIAASALASTALGATPESQPASATSARALEQLFPNGAWCHWLDEHAPEVGSGVTWGMPWPRSKHSAKTNFALRDKEGNRVPLQTWPMAYWPDGSLKWTAHAVPPNITSASTAYEVLPGEKSPSPAVALKVKQDATAIDIDTGVITCRVLRKGAVCIETIRRGGKDLLRAGRLVVLRQDAPAEQGDAVVTQETFECQVEQATVEHEGPIRAVVKITGVHSHASGRRWLPFTLRLYFYAGGEDVRMLHTFVFDGDEARDFIRGIGVRFDVPLTDELHNRHVRFAGERDGLFG